MGATLLAALMTAAGGLSKPARAEPPPVQVLIASEVLDGVPALATAGVPGPLAVLGADARVLVAGRHDARSVLPVAAAARWDKGRVIALGHGGMIGGEALRHTGTSRFVINAVTWLGGGEATRIGVLRNDAMLTLLRGAGFKAEALRGRWPDALRDFDAVVIDAHSIGDGEREAVARFIRDGGGLLTAGLGWGWLQLNPGRTIHEHPGNRLLLDAGLAWCDGTLEPTEPGAFTVTMLPNSTHAEQALDALEGAISSHPGASAPPALDPQVGSTLLAALRVLPRDHPLMRQAMEILESPAAVAIAAQGPSQEKPLRARQALERTLLALRLERDRHRTPEEVTVHPAASAFPGEVPESAPRVERRVEIDLAKGGWQSTGLYAPPGEVITVVPEEEDHSAEGLLLRIGCHTDQLWHLERWQRVPEIVTIVPGAADGIHAASAFGGLIYLEVTSRRPGSLALLVSGAIEAPRFILGSTTPDEWASARHAPAPWGELESSKVIVSVPSAVLRELDDPTGVMEFWNRISDAHATLATIPLDPPFPHRFVADLQISAGYMHSGYPIMTHLDAAIDMVSLDRLQRGSWGLLHELGHNHQEGAWTFDGTVEVTVNLFTLYAIDSICSPEPGSRGHPAVDRPPSVKEHLAKGAPFEEWKNDPFLALQMYLQLQEAFGWETFKRVFAEYRALPASERPRSDDEKRDQWMVRFSRASSVNLGPFFEAWGVPTSDAARRSISDLPRWMPDSWPEG
ncbi:MAG: M60 family metallopeptidase [Phycisphaeraceae bacterium]|nr:M60 family metallopeptidase [Phycisphaeraceae bacterium]